MEEAPQNFENACPHLGEKNVEQPPAFATLRCFREGSKAIQALQPRQNRIKHVLRCNFKG